MSTFLVPPGGVRLVIACSEGTVAEVEGYKGPIPQAGQYIGRPPSRGGGVINVMSVETVTYHILDRAPEGGFTASADPWVEVFV